jgi:hypothetical protein
MYQIDAGVSICGHSLAKWFNIPDSLNQIYIVVTDVKPKDEDWVACRFDKNRIDVELQTDSGRWVHSGLMFRVTDYLKAILPNKNKTFYVWIEEDW